MSPASNQGSNGGISDEPRGIIETAIFKRKGDLLMQKKIIALAVAGLMSGAAFAQSNVTVYGVVDAYVANWSGNGERVTGIQSGALSTSRLGFKGVEDLGGGLKAVFNIEGKLMPDAGTFGGGDRQLNVGLSGGFGTVLVGTMSTLADSWMAQYDYAGNLSARVVLADTLTNIAVAKTTALAYVSPNFSGLTIGAANIFGEQATGATRTNTFQIGANYMNGPLGATALYTKGSEADVNGADASEYDLGASYDFGVAKVMGVYERSKNTLLSTVANKFWGLGAVIPVGKGAVHFGYGKRSNDADDTDTSVTTLAYSYGFSKRTTGYVGYARVGNDDGASVEPHASFTSDLGKNYTGLVAGVRHTF
jgi:predicted porin